jgi:hypothetical protein
MSGSFITQYPKRKTTRIWFQWQDSRCIWFCLFNLLLLKKVKSWIKEHNLKQLFQSKTFFWYKTHSRLDPAFMCWEGTKITNHATVNLPTDSFFYFFSLSRPRSSIPIEQHQAYPLPAADAASWALVIVPLPPPRLRLRHARSSACCWGSCSPSRSHDFGMRRLSTSDEDYPLFDPSWYHLKAVYELHLGFVMSPCSRWWKGRCQERALRGSREAPRRQ